MRVDEAKCFGCKACIPYCPVNSITMGPKHIAIVDEDLCVECGNCQRGAKNICGAFYRPKESLEWPRVLRATFSDIAFESPFSRLKDRGGGRKKTTDVDGIFWPGDIGVQVELGRPNTGVSFRDVEKITKALAELGICFDPLVSTTRVMEDSARGTFPEDVLKQRALTVFVSFTTEEAGFVTAMQVILRLCQDLRTLTVITLHRKVEPGQEMIPLLALNKLGLSLRPNGKVNLGLGKPAFDFSKRRNP